MDKKRILVLTSTFPRWESDTEPVFIFQLCKSLKSNGYEIDVIAPHAPESKLQENMDGITVYRYRYCLPGLEKLAYAGGIMANLNKWPLLYLLVPLFILFQAITVFKLLRRNSYDLVHAHWLIPQGLVCAFITRFFFRRPIPILCTSHGSDLYSLRNVIFNKLRRWSVNNIKCLTVVSHAMMHDYIAAGIDDSKIRVLPMGADLINTFVPDSKITRIPHRLIFVGRLIEKKGVATLMEAVQIVASTYPDIELLMIGDGPMRHSLSAAVQAEQLDRNVIIKGSVNNHRLPEFYSAAAIAVMPSLTEGLGLVLIEAMGCGCAVVASALEPVAEVITDGENGLLFKPGDAQGLAEKLLLLLSDPVQRNELARRGRESVLPRFDWDVVGRQYGELIHTICSGGPGPG